MLTSPFRGSPVWMPRGLVFATLGLIALAVLFWPRESQSGLTLPEPPNQAPEAWINSAPLTKADLQGKVVLVEIWTFG